MIESESESKRGIESESESRSERESESKTRIHTAIVTVLSREVIAGLCGIKPTQRRLMFLEKK